MNERDARKLLGSTEEDHVLRFADIMGSNQLAIIDSSLKSLNILTRISCTYVDYLVDKVTEGGDLA